MIKRTIEYIDYLGQERTEDFYFNLTRAEVMEMETMFDGGLGEHIKSLIRGLKQPEIVQIFKMIILKSYGEKSPDGRRFIKSPELSKAFSETEAYSILFNELATDGKAAADFINGIVPSVPDPGKSNTVQLPTS